MPFVVHQIVPSPGPAAYNETSKSMLDSFTLSKHNRSFSKGIKDDVFKGPSKYSRFGYSSETAIPGPGTYDTSTTDLFATMKTSTERLGDNGKNKIAGNSERLLYFKSKSFTPGPGEYQTPSAFGQYIDAKAYLEVIKQVTDNLLPTKRC